MIPYGKQSIEEDDIAAVVRALRSDFLTCGPEVEAFQREFAELVGARHAIAVCNATAALHLAMLVADIGPGHRVVTSPNTFLASANCAAYVGATPDFADIDSGSYNLSPDALEQAWRPDTRAVVAVDYAGVPANTPRIAEIARARGAIVIEDACHGVGGGFRREHNLWKLGGHPWADMTTFSFHPVKTMTTGEGGMLVTDNDEYARRACLLRTHGMVREPGRFQMSDGGGQKLGVADPRPTVDPLSSYSCPLTSEKGPWYYEMQELGFNYRITDLQCALGRCQLRRLPQFITRRQEIVARYNEAFADLSWIRTPLVSEFGSQRSDLSFRLSDLSLHLYTVQIDFTGIGLTRTELMADLRERGIGTQVLYIPVHLQPWYRKTFGYGQGKCPNAEAFYTRCLSLPLYPAMTDDDVEKVVSQLKSIARI